MHRLFDEMNPQRTMEEKTVSVTTLNRDFEITRDGKLKFHHMISSDSEDSKYDYSDMEMNRKNCGLPNCESISFFKQECDKSMLHLINEVERQNQRLDNPSLGRITLLIVQLVLRACKKKNYAVKYLENRRSMTLDIICKKCLRKTQHDVVPEKCVKSMHRKINEEYK